MEGVFVGGEMGQAHGSNCNLLKLRADEGTASAYLVAFAELPVLKCHIRLMGVPYCKRALGHQRCQ